MSPTPLVRGIEAFFTTLPDDIKAVVIYGAGDHFSAGLDLSEYAATEHRANFTLLPGGGGRLE